MSEERLIILQKIESGDLSVEDGRRLIDLLDGREFIDPKGDGSPPEGGSKTGPRTVDQVDVIETGHEKTSPPDFSRWRTWAWVVFGLFVFLTALSALWMVLGWQTRPWGLGFWLSWVPFLMGITGMAATYRARWLHIRIRQVPGSKPEKISISLPLPLGLASWFMSTFSGWMPAKVRDQKMGLMIQELDRNIIKNEPVHIQVEGDDGEQVEVFIG